MKLTLAPPVHVAVNARVSIPQHLYDRVVLCAAAHGATPADVLNTVLYEHLSVLEGSEEGSCAPRKHPGKHATPALRVRPDLMRRVDAVVRRMYKHTPHSEELVPGGSRAAVVQLCISRVLTVPIDAVEQTPLGPKAKVSTVQLLIPVPPQVRTFLDASPDWSSASAFVRHALTEELSSCAANPSIGKQTAVRPRGAQGWCTLSVRIPSSQHDQLRAGAIRRRLSHLQLARVCIVRAVLRQLKAQSAAKEFHAKVQAIRTEQSTSAPGSAV